MSTAKKYQVITFGCAMNKSDSERIAAVLEQMGYRKASFLPQADLVVVNACSVRQSAIDRVYGQAQIFKNLKQKKQITTIVTGCILNKDRKEFAKRFDLLFNIKKVEELPNLLQKLNPDLRGVPDSPLVEQVRKMRKIGTFSPEEESYLNIVPRRQKKALALIPVSSGCNKFCTYCAVPYTRGLEVNRPAKDIVAECRGAVENGAKEIMLLGQTVNSYKDKNGVDFAQLLATVNDIPGKFWIRFQSPYPTEFSNEIIRVMAECEKVNKYVNLPLQSGDNNVLRRMNRRYSLEQYKDVVCKMRKAMPGMGLATDIIVGFCGETAEEFQSTAEVMDEIKYDMAYIARYSPRPGTVAEQHFRDDVPAKEKKQRHKILTEILERTALEQSRPYQGKVVEVLIAERRRKYLYGQTNTMKNVIVPIAAKSMEKLIGNFMRVKISKAEPFVLEGKII